MSCKMIYNVYIGIKWQSFLRVIKMPQSMIKKGLILERYLKSRDDKSVMSNQAYLLIFPY